MLRVIGALLKLGKAYLIQPEKWTAAPMSNQTTSPATSLNVHSLLPSVLCRSTTMEEIRK
jgi:hypothetical protein